MSSLGELRAVVGQDERHVRVPGRAFVAERVDEHELIRRVGKVFLTSNHVRDLHQRVVNRARELVGRVGV